MRGLKLAFAWSFAAASLLLLWITAVILAAIVIGGTPTAPHVAKAELIAIPLALSVLYGLAWWTVLKQKASARIWADIACFMLVLLSLSRIYVHPVPLLSPEWLALPIGIVGLIAFVRSGTAANPAGKRPVYAPLPGDGTNSILNKAVLIVGSVAGIATISLWVFWAALHGLTDDSPFLFLLQLPFIIILTVVVHEAAHALAGRTLGMRVTAFVIGPFQWWRTPEGKGTFHLHAAGLAWFQGLTRVAPMGIQDLRRRKILQVAAGPAASIATGILASIAVLTAPGRPWQADWKILAYFASLSLVTGVFNLVPFGIKSGYSDGARLYQLLSGGLWCNYQLTLSLIYAQGITPLQPRDWDIDAIQRAAGYIAKDGDEFLMHLCAYTYFFDTGQLPEAAAALLKAEKFCQESFPDPPAEWLPVFVFGSALIRRDADAARRWWNRLENTPSLQSEETYWTSKSALLWIENQPAAALEAWKNAALCASQLPPSRLAEGQRKALHLLRQALDGSLSSNPAPVLAATN